MRKDKIVFSNTDMSSVRYYKYLAAISAVKSRETDISRCIPTWNFQAGLCRTTSFLVVPPEPVSAEA